MWGYIFYKHVGRSDHSGRISIRTVTQSLSMSPVISNWLWWTSPVAAKLITRRVIVVVSFCRWVGLRAPRWGEQSSSVRSSCSPSVKCRHGTQHPAWQRLLSCRLGWPTLPCRVLPQAARPAVCPSCPAGWPTSHRHASTSLSCPSTIIWLDLSTSPSPTHTTNDFRRLICT